MPGHFMMPISNKRYGLVASWHSFPVNSGLCMIFISNKPYGMVALWYSLQINPTARSFYDFMIFISDKPYGPVSLQSML